jgi:hypothetical protein
VKDDLNKAEQQWAQRRLFTSRPRRRGRWLWLLLLTLVVGSLLYRFASAPALGRLDLPLF